MGMFDQIVFEMPCPICKEPLKDWQSKSGPCILEDLTPADLWAQREPDPLGYADNVQWYEYCGNCGTNTTINIQGCIIEEGQVHEIGKPPPEYRTGPDLTKAKP